MAGKTKRQPAATRRKSSARGLRKRKSQKGALIKGMTKRLPIELIGSAAFKTAIKQLMRNSSGIYILYKRKKVYYIGLAKDLYWRLGSHTKGKHKGKWDSFAIYRVARLGYLKDIETLLLQIIKPPGNSVSGHFRRDADLSRILKRKANEQARSLKYIRKALSSS